MAAVPSKHQIYDLSSPSQGSIFKLFSSTNRQIAASTAELLYDEDTNSEFKEVMPVITYYYEPLVFIVPIFFQRPAMLDYKCVASPGNCTGSEIARRT